MDTDFDWKKWRAQLIVIVLAAGVAWAIVGSGEGQEIESPPSPAVAFDMLYFLDEKVMDFKDEASIKARDFEHYTINQQNHLYQNFLKII